MNHFIGNKKQIKIKNITERILRILMLPLTFPIFIFRWIAYNIEEIVFGLDKYIYEPMIIKISTWLAKKF